MFRFFFFISLFLPLSGYSQGTHFQTNAQSGTITGTLIDSVTRAAASYVTIGILEQTTGKIVVGGSSDEMGVFRFIGLPLAAYQVKIDFIGYKPKSIKNIKLTPEKPDYNLGTITLAADIKLLDEVRITAEGALIQAKADKFVYNVERDVTTTGGDASDVLRKVPMLTVDIDGNISMRGSENVKILVNGKTSGMFSSNVADALKMMPADQIKSVEVITAPTAKFDGEGTAGIINIITKKKNIEGVAGSVELTTGTRNHRGNGNLNYGKGRFGLNLSGGGHYNIPQEGATSYLRESFGDLRTILIQEGTNESSRLGYRANGGIEYNIDESNTLTTSFSYRNFDHNTTNSVLSEYGQNLVPIDTYRRIVDGSSSRGGWDFEMDYKKQYAKKDQEWSLAIEIDQDLNESDFDYDQQFIFPANRQSVIENNLNNRDNLEMTFQTDYVHPFSEKIKLESGLKSTLRQTESDFSFRRFDTDVNKWILDTERTDIFYYDQNVYGGYASTIFEIGDKISLITGLRMEITYLSGSFNKVENAFDNQYLNLLPNITIAKKSGEYNMLRLSYNQRIQRPNQRHINPFIEYNDNRDISFGNPSLTPELVHQVELGTTFFIKGNMLSTSVFGRQTNDVIENLVLINNQGVSESTYYNFGNRSSIGLNVFGSLNIGPVSLRGGFDVNAWRVNGNFENQELSNDGFEFNGRMNITWTLNESTRIEGFSFYQSPTYTVQGRTPNWSMMSFGLKKELFKKRFTVGINITEPFRENLVLVRKLEGPDFYQNSRTERPVRSFGITLGYKFGKLEFNERTGKKRVNNNDLKEEDHGNESQF
ncbi:MAG: TonB-dependent receptor [Bacteroidota bacterium]|nr:TonB-dependent receptor [Bacteroidota bacterium]